MLNLPPPLFAPIVRYRIANSIGRFGACKDRLPERASFTGDRDRGARVPQVVLDQLPLQIWIRVREKSLLGFGCHFFSRRASRLEIRDRGWEISEKVNGGKAPTDPGGVGMFHGGSVGGATPFGSRAQSRISSTDPGAFQNNQWNIRHRT